MSQVKKRAAIGKQKMIDSIHDMASRHGLKADVSPEITYFSFTDPTVMVTPQDLMQEQMMVMGPLQAMPAPGQGMYQQQPAYAPQPTGVGPMMPQGYAQAPQGYALQPQNVMYGAPPIQTYDPMNVKE